VLLDLRDLLQLTANNSALIEQLAVHFKKRLVSVVLVLNGFKSMDQAGGFRLLEAHRFQFGSVEFSFHRGAELP
jgi:hypothetical protein